MSGIGVTLRVTGHFDQGDRDYMEDMSSIAFHPDLEYAFFGIFDGHGGPEAAKFAKENLLSHIVNNRNFWSSNDKDVLRAIRNGYIATHYEMKKDSENWPKKSIGLPSTSGCTATIAFIMRGKIYIGHAGDSAVVLGYQEDGVNEWKTKVLTRGHKPSDKKEKQRIERYGGKVAKKAGVHRVVWYRPRMGKATRSRPFDEVPFSAVARSLGDFWSYNSSHNKFVVSPKPDLSVCQVDKARFRCLILGTDGLWDMLTGKQAVSIVQAIETCNQNKSKDWLNPSKILVSTALEKWAVSQWKADNTSAVTLLMDPPDYPNAMVLLKQMDKCQEEISAVEESRLFISETRGITVAEHFPSTREAVTDRCVPFGATLPMELCSNPKEMKVKRKRLQGGKVPKSHQNAASPLPWDRKWIESKLRTAAK